MNSNNNVKQYNKNVQSRMVTRGKAANTANNLVQHQDGDGEEPTDGRRSDDGGDTTRKDAEEREGNDGQGSTGSAGERDEEGETNKVGRSGDGIINLRK
jgi:hypothetical protein